MNLISNKTLSLRAMLVALFAGLAIFGIAGCSDGGDDAITPEPEPAPQPQDKTQVIVDVSTLEVPEGKTAELRFKIVPSTVDISSADGLNVRIVDATTKQDIKQVAFDKGDIVLEGAGRYTVTVSSTVTEEYRTTACVMVTSKQNKTYLSNPFVLRNTPMVSEISSIVFTREKNPELADDIEFYYDEELNSFHARIKQIAPNTVDHSKLIATFIAEGCKSVTVNGVEQKSGVTVNDFTQPLKYVFTSVKGEVIEYDVSVTNHFTNLPVVYVNTDGKTHISGDITSKSEWKNATISITGNDQYDGLEQTTLQIRARGNTTLNWPKKAFNMKFEKQVKMLGIKKHKRWVMIANYCDATMLRNETAYYASSLTSLKWAPHGDFVELVYNGTYVGTYWLCEHVRVDKNRVAITETPQGDTSAKNTGYLVEYDFHGGSTSKPYWTSYINTQQQPDWNNRGNSSVRYVTKYPDENDLSTEQYEYIKKWVRDWEVDIRDKLTTNPDTADEEYEKYITKYIEPVSFVDYWLIYEVCLNHELRNPGSVFIHKDVEGGVADGKLIAGPVWDFDYGTFNFEYTDAGWYPEHVKRYELYLEDGIWYAHLFKNAKMKALAKERWEVLKPKFETMPAYIRQRGEFLKESAKENFAVWPMATSLNYDEKLSYKDAVEKMAGVVEERIKNMDDAIKKW